MAMQTKVIGRNAESHPHIWFVRMITAEGIFHPMHNGWIVRDTTLAEIQRIVPEMQTRICSDEFAGYELTYDVVEFAGIGNFGGLQIGEL